jgi:hypothetical protein
MGSRRLPFGRWPKSGEPAVLGSGGEVATEGTGVEVDQLEATGREWLTSAVASWRRTSSGEERW